MRKPTICKLFQNEIGRS